MKNLKNTPLSLRISEIHKRKLILLASDDHRSMTSQIEWLVDQETSRRYSQPNPLISIEEAEKAAQLIQ